MAIYYPWLAILYWLRAMQFSPGKAFKTTNNFFGYFMLPPSVITGAVIGGIYGLMSASSKGISYPSELAGWATPYLIFGALFGFILHILFFRK